jgi:glutamine synthetase type III
LPCLEIISKNLADDRCTISDLAFGSAFQFRMLGGALGIAVMNVVMNSQISRQLPSLIQGEQLADVLSSVNSIAQLPRDLQEAVRPVYGEAFNWEMRITITFSAATLLAVVLIWKRSPIALSKDGTLR